MGGVGAVRERSDGAPVVIAETGVSAEPSYEYESIHTPYQRGGFVFLLPGLHRGYSEALSRRIREKRQQCQNLLAADTAESPPISQTCDEAIVQASAIRAWQDQIIHPAREKEPGIRTGVHQAATTEEDGDEAVTTLGWYVAAILLLSFCIGVVLAGVQYFQAGNTAWGAVLYSVIVLFFTLLSGFAIWYTVSSVEGWPSRLKYLFLTIVVLLPAIFSWPIFTHHFLGTSAIGWGLGLTVVLVCVYYFYRTLGKLLYRSLGRIGAEENPVYWMIDQLLDALALLDGPGSSGSSGSLIARRRVAGELLDVADTIDRHLPNWLASRRTLVEAEIARLSTSVRGMGLDIALSADKIFSVRTSVVDLIVACCKGDWHNWRYEPSYVVEVREPAARDRMRNVVNRVWPLVPLLCVIIAGGYFLLTNPTHPFAQVELLVPLLVGSFGILKAFGADTPGLIQEGPGTSELPAHGTLTSTRRRVAVRHL